MASSGAGAAATSGGTYGDEVDAGARDGGSSRAAAGAHDGGDDISERSGGLARPSAGEPADGEAGADSSGADSSGGAGEGAAQDSSDGEPGEREEVDVTGDGGVLLRLTAEPAFNDVPDPGWVVTVRYTGRTAAGEVFTSPQAAAEGCSWELGKAATFPADVCAGLDAAVATLGPEDRATVRCVTRPYCFEEDGRASVGVPAGDAGLGLTYEVKLLRAVARRRNIFAMDDDEKERVAAECHQRGNAAYKEKRYGEAIDEYDRAHAHLDAIMEFPDPGQRPVINGKKVTMLLNGAMACLQADKFREAISLCSRALDHEPRNAKALFRRGLARVKLCEYKAGVGDLVEADALKPGDKAIRAALRRAKAQAAADKERTRRMYANMFKDGIGAPSDEAGEAAAAPKRSLYGDKHSPEEEAARESLARGGAQGGGLLGWVSWALRPVLHPLATARDTWALLQWCLMWWVEAARSLARGSWQLFVLVLSAVPVLNRLARRWGVSDAAGGAGGGERDAAWVKLAGKSKRA